MNAIEMETVISSDGRLPLSFQEVFGRRVRVIVLFDDSIDDRDDFIKEDEEEEKSHADHLMELAGTIHSFEEIEDPVKYQRQIRDEWVGWWEK